MKPQKVRNAKAFWIRFVAVRKKNILKKRRWQIALEIHWAISLQLTFVQRIRLKRSHVTSSESQISLFCGKADYWIIIHLAPLPTYTYAFDFCRPHRVYGLPQHKTQHSKIAATVMLLRKLLCGNFSHAYHFTSVSERLEKNFVYFWASCT